MSRNALRSGLMVAAMLVAASPALAQMCVGIPSVDGQYAVSGAVGFTEGAKTYGGSFQADLMGPLSVGVSYDLVDMDDIDTNANSFGGNVAYALPVSQLSACPVAGLSYTTMSETQDGVEFNVNSLMVPVGLGFGKAFPMGTSASVGLFASPAYLWVRNEVSGSEGGAEVSISDSQSEFAGTVGAAFAAGAFFGRGSVMFTSIENSDPLFAVNLGVLVGRR